MDEWIFTWQNGFHRHPSKLESQRWRENEKHVLPNWVGSISGSVYYILQRENWVSVCILTSCVADGSKKKREGHVGFMVSGPSPID